ncbi:N-acetylmuramoyl-L-alanine amidase-like domain-containing protein [Dysgonomonas sp. 216]|uniref:N-acetylmuramoyl-L-alanine amidase-like domain-containing protein n=1 Tax=Dysgonomonas sp. 216 TaxID=2302934 RepID=UPI001C869425|nr:N-acetylmuramoyl-L-alanine amidase-like domain-containing protein [Dysgonomonas sp. 216]
MNASNSELKAQVSYSPIDSTIFVAYADSFAVYQDEPMDVLVVKTAKYFLGKPYVGSTLDHSKKEQLTVNLHEFDCMTFVENCIVLSQTIKSGDISFSNYCRLLQQSRYRNGVIDDYSSRLHYTSDWMYEKEQKNVLHNISKSLGGRLENKLITFMSAHPDSYKQLSGNKFLQEKIKKIEAQLNKRGGYYVINKQLIEEVDDKIRNGDIVLISTSVSGLDFSHLGIAYRNEEGVLTFIHASSLRKQVVIEPRSLAKYCDASSRCNGITILRLSN